jgi:hypothetical protein
MNPDLPEHSVVEFGSTMTGHANGIGGPEGVPWPVSTTCLWLNERIR